MVPILAIALTLPIFAQQAERDVKTGGTGKEETLKLMINGGADVAFSYESGQLRETSHWLNGGLGNVDEGRDPYYYFNGPAWLSFVASLQDNVELTIVLRTIPNSDDNHFQDNGGNDPITNRRNWGDDLNGAVFVKYAYMRVKELFNPQWSLSIGQMDVIWDIRGKGNAIFLDVAHAESPWGDIERAWATTVRTESTPVGFKVGFNPDRLNLELGLFPVTQEAQAAGLGIATPYGARQQGLYYVSGIYNIDDQGNKIGAIIAFFHGINPGDNVWTIGLAGSFSPGKDFELFGEGYVQGGQSWSQGRRGIPNAAPVPVHGDDGTHRAYAFLLGGRMDIPGDTAVMLELHLYYATGHDMDEGTQFGRADGFNVAANDDSSEFMSYENYDVMVILNSNEWGYDLDNNIFQITGQVGLMVSTGGAMKNNLHLIAKLAYAVAPEEWAVAATANHPQDEVTAYGFEIDLTARWFMNKNASIYWTFAYLAGSQVAELFSFDEDDFAWTMLLGFSVSN
jgi:hypothetical protein